MSVVKAYHAGDLENIELFLDSGSGLSWSTSQGNWLGGGVYFWENDPERAEDWQAQKGKGAILECEIDTRFLFNLLRRERSTEIFYEEAQTMLLTLGAKTSNNKKTQSYGLDCDLFNAIRNEHMKDFYGVRMAFYLGASITPDGNIFKDQHIQICLWDTGAIENPRKYIPSL